MKHCSWIALLLLLSPALASAQNFLSINGKAVDEFYFDFTWDYWLNSPSNMEFEPLRNRGITISSVFRLDEGENKLGVAPGIAFSSTNIHTNVKKWDFNDEGEITDIYQDPEYRKNKIVLSYIGIPFELQYRHKDKSKTFKAALGVRGGYLVDLHTKLKKSNGNKIKRKFREPFQEFRYGAYLRAGYSRVYFYGYWGVSNVFDHENAPGTQSLSVGVSLSGF